MRPGVVWSASWKDRKEKTGETYIERDDRGKNEREKG